MRIYELTEGRAKPVKMTIEDVRTEAPLGFDMPVFRGTNASADILFGDSYEYTRRSAFATSNSPNGYAEDTLLSAFTAVLSEKSKAQEKKLQTVEEIMKKHGYAA